jgi:hypothetical protein
MAYTVISVPIENKSKVKVLLKDDFVSRQSITTRDASALNIKRNVHYIVIEGDMKAIERARELFRELGTVEPETEAEKIYTKIKEEEQSAALGVGFIFGEQ